MVKLSRRFLGGVTALALLAWPIPGFAQPCTLLKVARGGKADLVVYFTRFVEEDATKGKYRQCRIVSSKADGTRTFVVTPFRQDASVVVHRSNWPK